MRKNPAAFGLRTMTAAERAAGRFMRAPDGHGDGGAGGGTGETEKTTEREQQQEQQKEAPAAPTAEEVAQLRADLAAAQAEAAKFNGIDPQVAKDNAKKVADAEKAARDAETAKATAEGNFERLRELQNEEHEAQLAALRTERDEARTAAAQAIVDATNARRAKAFATSQFFAKETILAAEKAERLYGDFVEIKDGVAVVYDAPATAAKRTVLMDAKGNPLAFDDAFRKVIEKEADKDTFLRSKIAPGGGSKTVDGGKSTETPTDRQAKLAAGLKKLRGQ